MRAYFGEINQMLSDNSKAISRLNKLVDHLQNYDSNDSPETLAHVISEAAAEIEMIIDEME